MSYGDPMYSGGPYPPPSRPAWGYEPGPSAGHVQVSYRRAPNFLQRIGGSLVGSVFGVFLVMGACVLLFWNEVLKRQFHCSLAKCDFICHVVPLP